MRAGGDACPHCGFNNRFFQQPENALPEGSILHGRYLVGRVTGRTADEITYSGFDLTLESLLQIHEYAPADTVREADACTVAFADEAQRYDRKKEAKKFLERTKVLLRGKTSVTGGSALIDGSLVAIVAEQVVHEDQKVISESIQTVLSECLNSVDLVP